MNCKLLDGKVVIITGGNSGMGLATAEMFVDEGASVVLFGRRKEKNDEAVAQLVARGGKAVAYTGDVSITDDCKGAFKLALDTFGKVDVVINNAGVGSMSKSIESTDDEFYDKLMAANLRGPFMLCREAMNYFLPRGEGNIINVSSVNAVRPITGAAYAASKAGLLALTKNIAMRTVGTKIRVNCMCPGFTLTPMAIASTMTAKDMANNDVKDSTVNNEVKSVGFEDVEPGDMFTGDGKMSGYLHARTNRFCISTTDDDAKALLFLASDLSSGVHGQALVVDHGGYL